jgi:hypothetical protein
VVHAHDRAVFAFVREKDGDKVFVVLNLSDAQRQVRLKGAAFVGDYTGAFSQEKVFFSEDGVLSLGPWEYRVYVKGD